MLINTSPADEIAEIRGQIRILKAREAELRAGFLTGQHPCRGAAHEVTVKIQRQRSFLKERLPADILRNPALWSERVTPTVLVRPRQQADAGETDADDDFAVIEPFA